ncbi:hypothetical protein FRC00_007162 [Tulasnella sp. 408]|nr:hypothetical protein FRC00_007162 [Tulasnella sp. 408]
MKTSIFAVAASLLFAAFAAANPAPINDLATTPNTLEPRCQSCNDACPKTHFYYAPKKCCLQNGGPKNPGNPPKDEDCPKYWYWNGDKKCCTPRYPQPSNPKPTCGSSTFPWWDKDRHCCRKPPTGTNPPGPGTSKRATRDVHQPKSKYAHRKAELKSRQPAACPAGMMVCPMKDGVECLENAWEIRACGGCPTFGVGQDCEAISNSMNVGCESVDNKPTCVVHSCKDGFTPAKGGKSCVAA